MKSKGIKLSDHAVSGDAIIKKVILSAAAQREAAGRIKALERQCNELLDEFTAYRNARQVPHAPARPRDGRAEKVRVIAGDLHGMRQDPAAASAFLADLKTLDPDEIVFLGDMLDCEGWLAKHHTIGFVANCDYSYAEDTKATNDFVDRVQFAAPHAVIHWCDGNHECLSPEHEVLTATGWKAIADITLSDTVAGMGPDGATVWQQPTKTHVYHCETELVTLQTRGVSAAMTGNHRVPYLMSYGNRARIRYRRADSIPVGASVDFITAGQTRTDSVPYTDDQIRLAAWLLTDGCISSTVSISQSKPETTAEIRELLTRMDIQFSARTRQRDIRSICGRKLIKPSLPSTEFHFSGEGARTSAKLLGVDWSAKCRGVPKKVPVWVQDLSDARFDIFIDTVIRANGSRAGARAAACIYGSRQVLDGLQAACATHGYRASLKPRTRAGQFSFWALNIVKGSKIRVEGKSISRVPYTGPVYCLTMPCENFFTRLGGCVHLTGNSRVERAITDLTLGHQLDSEMLMKLWGPAAVLRLDDRGIKWYRRDAIYGEGLPRGWIKIDKMCFTHELGRGKNAARDAVARSAVNVTFGHTHRADSATIVFPGVGICKAFNPGCLCLVQPIFMHSDPTSWSQGYDVDFVAKSGNFQRISVPIWRGESLAGAMVERFKS